MATTLSGKDIAKKVNDELLVEIDKLCDLGVTPGLTVVLVGDDEASQIYVRNKAKACEALGIESNVVRLSRYISQSELIEVIKELNADNAVDGILVQLPLPNHIDPDAVLEAIDPKKDVDGFHALNAGRLMQGVDTFEACTPKGIMRMLKESGVKLRGANAVVVGRSNIVGKPIAMMLLKADCTVTVCHSKTRDLSSYTKNADVLVVATGIPNFIKGDMIKPGAVVIDVGMDHDENGKLCGDVEFESAEKVAGFITPVPGGVGPMTIAMLMSNTVQAAKQHANIK
ncbi:MAG: bifunctional methylenetetrahydrofolate dehydrogenase/methenyltetrahydrofolate cyclohydrolase FolD [Clostridiales bacterium]|nr:bifunctional methylenetetrahydrofolate dehydrogenase/methenyltetrahydrofolate cyclohydrolase FolD [Clostridiales bacterium]